MTVALLKNLSIALYIMSGILFGISAVLFFVLRIPIVIRELSGSEAKRAIQDIQKQNESGRGIDLQSEVKQPIFTGAGKRKRRNKIPGITDTFNVGFDTAKIDTLRMKKKGDETALLEGAGSAEEGTALLSPEYVAETFRHISQQGALNNNVAILFDITFIHTDEWIE